VANDDRDWRGAQCRLAATHPKTTLVSRHTLARERTCSCAALDVGLESNGRLGAADIAVESTDCSRASCSPEACSEVDSVHDTGSRICGWVEACSSGKGGSAVGWSPWLHRMCRASSPLLPCGSPKSPGVGLVLSMSGGACCAGVVHLTGVRDPSRQALSQDSNTESGLSSMLPCKAFSKLILPHCAKPEPSSCLLIVMQVASPGAACIGEGVARSVSLSSPDASVALVFRRGTSHALCLAAVAMVLCWGRGCTAHGVEMVCD
jgi:hypothetical protein